MHGVDTVQRSYHWRHQRLVGLDDARFGPTRWQLDAREQRNAMSNFDHYATARELISRLSRTGHTIEAATLKAAMDEGATGTEILMALRFHLGEIIKRLPLAGDTATLASRLLAELDDALE